jgi:hypothetical protein
LRTEIFVVWTATRFVDACEIEALDIERTRLKRCLRLRYSRRICGEEEEEEEEEEERALK